MELASVRAPADRIAFEVVIRTVAYSPPHHPLLNAALDQGASSSATYVP